MQSLVPKPGDIFTDQNGADLNGSKELTNWVQKGTYWTSFSSNQPFPAIATRHQVERAPVIPCDMNGSECVDELCGALQSAW